MGITNTLIGLIQSLILAVIGVLNTFGIWTLTEDQRGAILILWGALSAILLYWNATRGTTARIKAAAVAHGESVPKL